MSETKIINKIYFEKYLCQKKIGKGSFGTVFEGINTKNNDKIALKLEKRDKSKSGTLETEAYRLLYLQGEGVPKIYCYGNNSTHNILIQELLGDSLETIFNNTFRKFSLKTICVLGIEMIKRIQWIHSRHHIHRDIKPDNFTIGRDKNANKIYIIDFGLSKKYYSDSKQRHIKFCKGKSLTGTARYCSRHAHLGYEQSRRDDIESIGYVLMYFLLGSLPWQGLKVKNGEDHFDVIAKKKINTPFEDLCKGQPEELLKYFLYCDKLEFEEEPDYNLLIGLFQSMIDKHCVNCNYDFDWNKHQCNYLPTSFTIDESKNNKSRDISLFVNKNNNASVSIESTNKGIKENNEVFITDQNPNDYSFEVDNGNNNNNIINHNGNNEEEMNNNNFKKSKTKNSNEITQKETDKDITKANNRRHRKNSDKKKNKSRSVPKNLNKEEIYNDLKMTKNDEETNDNNNKYDNTNNNNLNNSRLNSEHSSKNKYQNTNHNSKAGKEQQETKTNEEEINTKQGKTSNRRKRYSSDDLTKKPEKDGTKCGCLIF